jgi:hypothetical protein
MGDNVSIARAGRRSEAGDHRRDRQTSLAVLALSSLLAIGWSSISPRDALWAYLFNAVAPAIRDAAQCAGVNHRNRSEVGAPSCRRDTISYRISREQDTIEVLRIIDGKRIRKLRHSPR